MAQHIPARQISLDGIHNLRDLGGYHTRDGFRTRWRTLFRADAPHRLTPSGRQALLEHGLRTVIDLRAPNELEAAPSIFRAASEVRYHHLPLRDARRPGETPVKNLEDLYQRYLDTAQDKIAAVIGRLAEPDALPALFNCSAGKDRTGLIAALLLGLAGVPKDTIVQDYALTGQLTRELFDEFRARERQKGSDMVHYEMLLECRAEAMATTLDYLEARHGDVTGFLVAAGLARDVVLGLRERLIEKPPAE